MRLDEVSFAKVRVVELGKIRLVYVELGHQVWKGKVGLRFGMIWYKVSLGLFILYEFCFQWVGFNIYFFSVGGGYFQALS